MDWSPPTFALSTPPATKETFHLDDGQNFARTARWSPDGSVFLAQSENRSFQLFNNTSTLFPQPAPILDFLWYPAATPHDPASFCFLSSVRECPVKLIDASDGRLRASYRIVDHRERQIAPHALAFNPSAQRIYCGFEDAIEIFDLASPGSGTRLPTTPSKKSKDGLKGIISSLAFASYTSDLYAVGSLSPTPSNIALFTEEQGSTPIMFVSGGPKAGVTQIHFNPTQPHIMYASFRRQPNIYAWDLRSNVDSPLTIYKPGSCPDTPNKNERTNQKLRFDVDICGRVLAVGDHVGTVSLFNLDHPDLPNEHVMDTITIHPDLNFTAHSDAIGSVSFNPTSPVLLTVSGSRHFDVSAYTSSSSSSSEEDSDSESELDDDNTPASRGISKKNPPPHPVTLDSSIKTWSF